MALAGQHHAVDVPGEAGQDMAAQPFAERQHRREHEDAPGATSARPAGRAPKPSGREDGEEGRQRDHDAERHRPGELVGLDEEGGAEPPQAPRGRSRSPTTSRGCGRTEPASDGGAHRPRRRSARPRRSSARRAAARDRAAAGRERRRRQQRSAITRRFRQPQARMTRSASAERSVISPALHRRFCRPRDRAAMDAQALDPALIGVEHLED